MCWYQKESLNGVESGTPLALYHGNGLISAIWINCIKEVDMKQILRKKMPLAITCWTVIIGMLLLSSPAFSKERYNDTDGRKSQEPSHTYSTPVKHDTCTTPVKHSTTNRNRASRVKVVQHNGSLIPAIVATGLIAGITFSLLDNTAHATQQTAVATTYPVVTNQVVTASSVMVTANLLNIRSGPGLNQTPIRQISRGTVLTVIGASSGWYMVQTSDGSTGWVMVQFTTPVAPPAAG
jgi:hypothetical protein